MLVIKSAEPIDLIGKLLEHVCEKCTFARENEHLPLGKRICSDGYGIKRMMDRGCGAWRAIEAKDDG